MPGDARRRRGGVPPELLIVAAAISVQGGGATAAGLLRTHSAFAVVFMRIAFSAIALLVLRRPRRGSVPRGAWRDAILLGVAMAAMNSLFYTALARIPLGVVVTIEFCGPLLVAVSGSRRPRDLGWVVLAAAGIYLLAGGRLVADDAVGVAAAFGAGMCWAVFILLGTRVAHAWPDGRGLTVTMTAAALVVLPLALLAGDLPGIVQPEALLGGLTVALLSSAIPYTLELAAMRAIPSSTYGVLMSLEPAVAAIVGLIFLGQVLGSSDIVAIGCVGLASAGASRSGRQRDAVPGELEAA